MKNSECTRQHASDVLYCFLRVAILVSVIFLLVPALNPARISGLINRNMSLFSSGFSYSNLTSGFGRAFKKGWVERSTMQLLFGSSLVVCLGVFAAVAGACMSIGNGKFKRLSNLFILAGSAAGVLGMAGIHTAYVQIAATSKPKKVEPMFSGAFWPFIAILLIILALVLIEAVLVSKTPREDKFEMESKYKLFLLFLPFLALCGVFSYLPLWGWRYAFFDYKVGDTLSMDNFVGLKWFTQLFQNEATVKDVVRVLKNTLGMSALGICTSWIPMAFAIFLSEIKNDKFRRFVQTFTTIPNFISWVLVYAIAFCIFSTDGFVSSLMVNAGIWSSGQNMLMSSSHTWLKMWAWGMWKGVGWSAIIYIAAISGIDRQLYEAATVDGAGRFQRMWNITVPSLIPTFCVLLLMSVANVLSNGMDQYLVFENATNTDYVMVLDLYVYKLGIGQGMIPLTTVVSMLKSIVSVVLLFGANGISKLVRGESII